MEVNYPRLAPQSQLALFALVGLALGFLNTPASRRLTGRGWRALDLALVALTVVCFGYVFVQTEPVFQSWWSSAQSLGNRAGHETTVDTLMGVLGLALGWPGIVVGTFLGIFAAGLFSLGLLLVHLARRRYAAFLAIPYGPFLVLGAAFVLYGGKETLQALFAG